MRGIPPFHFERALFVIGDPNTGKSVQLRHIFQDVRFHREVPTGADAQARLPEMHRISNERVLYLRLTSPHEVGEDLESFLGKTEHKITRNAPYLGHRWNFAGPLQPTAANKMPSAAEAIEGFIQRFNPERVRAIFLSPDHHGARLADNFLSGETEKLWRFRAEVLAIDARRRDANGLILADFFDFT